LSRELLLGVMVALPLLAVANVIVFGLELRAFVARVPIVRSSADLEDFKAVVARQMYAALVQIALGIAPFGVWAWGRFGLGLLATPDLLFATVPAMLLGIPGLWNRDVEARMKQTPCADTLLQAELERVVRVWMRRPFPSW
jgi:hypothetical protein